MFLQASKIISKPVGELDTQSKIADVDQIIVDLDTGDVIALLVKRTGFLGENKILPIREVISFDANGVVTKNEESLVGQQEIIKVDKIIQDKSFVIGMHANTESNKNLGKIFDFVFDSETYEVEKFYIKNLTAEQILPTDKVVKIEKDKVIFSDDVLKLTKNTDAKINIIEEQTTA